MQGTSRQQQMTHTRMHTTDEQVSISNRESWLTSGSGVCVYLFQGLKAADANGLSDPYVNVYLSEGSVSGQAPAYRLQQLNFHLAYPLPLVGY